MSEHPSEKGFRLACRVEDLPDCGSLRVEFDDIDVAIVRSDGAVYAIEDVCSHAEVALSEGDVSGTTVECWLHGSCFDLRTGEPTGPPATQPVEVFEVRVTDGLVHVAEKAMQVMQQKEHVTS